MDSDSDPLSDTHPNGEDYSSVAQCPFCDTAFHLGLAQLEAANGKVRCGSCLRVFNAKEHFLIEQKRLFDTLYEQPGSPNSPEPGTPDEQRNFGPDGSLTAPPPQAGSSDTETQRPIEQDSADSEPNEPAELATVTEEISGYQSSDNDQTAQSKHASVKTIVDENQTRSRTRHQHTKAKTSAAETSTQYNDDLDLNDSDFFIENPEKPAKKTAYGWLGLCLMMLGISFVLQLLFFKPTFAHNLPVYQNLESRICPYIGCGQKPVQDLELIEVRGFIEAHPDYEEALQAKIDLINRAPFVQAFPDIVIRFRSLSGQVSASRVLSPKEYLRSEARQLGTMPQQRPIQIQIDLVDPGASSTGYEFSLLPARL